MSANSFGQIFNITSFGESHGPAIGVVIDGCPAGLPITTEEIQIALDRRKPGTSRFTSPRREKDSVEILSGVYEGKTLGTPIALLVRNMDAKSEAYASLKETYRPGHADFTYDAKYGIRDPRGGGRSSARETIARVAAGAVAGKLIEHYKITLVAYVSQIGDVKAQSIDEEEIENNPFRVPDIEMVKNLETLFQTTMLDGDSLGGVIEIKVRGVPPGLGEPVFHKLSADLSFALFSIPTVKAVEVGDGFLVAQKKGSENNDLLTSKKGQINTLSNHAGGIVGGISNGEEIVLRITLKPVSSIRKKQKTVDKNGNEIEISVTGRHDPCVCPRAVPIAEAMVKLVLADHLLLSKLNRL